VGALVAATALSMLLMGGGARAQRVSGFYVGAGAGGNFMGDESFSLTERVGAFRSVSRSPFGTSTFSYPPSSYGFHGPIGLDAGGVAVLSAGYGLGNGLRLEIEGDYRINSFSLYRGSEQKFGGMLNALYDLPVSLFGATPYAGLGAGYMWVDRGRSFDRTDGFAYQAILGGSVPVPGVPNLSATLEYRFMGLAGTAHRFTYPGYTFSSAFSSQTQDPSTGKAKYNDDFNHSLMIGLRYAFNVAPPAFTVLEPAPVRDSVARTYLVFFDWDRADLTDRARQIVAEAAQQTTRVQVTRIEVSGHTDATGSAPYNQGLSVRRAQNVAAELVRLGVPRGAITTQGFGFSRPLVSTGPGVREPQNRRVEIVLR